MYRGLLLASAVGLALPSLATAQVPRAPMAFDEEASERLAAGADLRESRPYLVVGSDAYAVPQVCWPRRFGGDDEGRRFGGGDEGRRFGGDDEGRRFGGGDEGRRFGGDDEGRRFGGDDEGRRFGGDEEGRRFGGGDEGRRFGGDDEGRRFGGDEEGRRFGGDQEGRRFGGEDEGRRFGGALGNLACTLIDGGTTVRFEPRRDGYVVSNGIRFPVVNGVLRFD